MPRWWPLPVQSSDSGPANSIVALLESRQAATAEATSAVGLAHLCGGGPKSRERGYRHHPR
jgi:hypothetical protein